jgi:hypothetical protein
VVRINTVIIASGQNLGFTIRHYGGKAVDQGKGSPIWAGSAFQRRRDPDLAAALGLAEPMGDRQWHYQAVLLTRPDFSAAM